VSGNINGYPCLFPDIKKMKKTSLQGYLIMGFDELANAFVQYNNLVKLLTSTLRDECTRLNLHYDTVDIYPTKHHIHMSWWWGKTGHQFDAPIPVDEQGKREIINIIITACRNRHIKMVKVNV
jgi:hypothetical protein